MAAKAYLIRQYFEKQTRGVFTAIDDDGNVLITCVIQELPWRDNQRRISCIPELTYQVKRRWTKKFKWHYHILDVPERDDILQHSGNYVGQILGCQEPGSEFQFLDGDNVTDVLDSRKTLDKMLTALGDEYTLYIGSFELPTFPHKVPVYHWSKIHQLAAPTLPSI